mmetsp:Transcript_57869/g.181731  ORF Transcript_57869/g.181731 Transcript_57869/m.181731 type:complete len:447 (+) Transcript_57869:189-1529(+)
MAVGRPAVLAPHMVQRAASVVPLAASRTGTVVLVVLEAPAPDRHAELSRLELREELLLPAELSPQLGELRVHAPAALLLRHALHLLRVKGGAAGRLEVAVRIRRVHPSAAAVAKVRAASRALHVVAALAAVDPHLALRTALRVLLQGPERHELLHGTLLPHAHLGVAGLRCLEPHHEWGPGVKGRLQLFRKVFGLTPYHRLARDVLQGSRADGHDLVPLVHRLEFLHHVAGSVHLGQVASGGELQGQAFGSACHQPFLPPLFGHGERPGLQLPERDLHHALLLRDAVRDLRVRDAQAAPAEDVAASPTSCHRRLLGRSWHLRQHRCLHSRLLATRAEDDVLQLRAHDLLDLQSQPSLVGLLLQDLLQRARDDLRPAVRDRAAKLQDAALGDVQPGHLGHAVRAEEVGAAAEVHELQAGLLREADLAAVHLLAPQLHFLPLVVLQQL